MEHVLEDIFDDFFSLKLGLFSIDCFGLSEYYRTGTNRQNYVMTWPTIDVRAEISRQSAGPTMFNQINQNSHKITQNTISYSYLSSGRSKASIELKLEHFCFTQKLFDQQQTLIVFDFLLD